MSDRNQGVLPAPGGRRFHAHVAALALLLALPAAMARADTQGATDRILAILINAPTSDAYPIHHGQIHVGNEIGGVAAYNWGGSYCPGLSLSDSEVALLQRGFDNPRMVIQPFYKNGQGGNLCLVAFRLILRSEQGLYP